MDKKQWMRFSWLKFHGRLDALRRSCKQDGQKNEVISSKFDLDSRCTLLTKPRYGSTKLVSKKAGCPSCLFGVQFVDRSRIFSIPI